jgi:Flp pilus assembly protein TadG
MASMTRHIVARLKGRAAAARGERGAELVEFAIIAPVMLFMMAGIIDFAVFFQSYQVTTNAAREGARLAMLPGYDNSGYATALARVDDYIAAAGVHGTYTKAVTPVTIDLGGGTTARGVQVTVTYTHTFSFVGGFVGLLSGTWNNSVTYTTGSVMRTEVQPAVVAP